MRRNRLRAVVSLIEPKLSRKFENDPQNWSTKNMNNLSQQTEKITRGRKVFGCAAMMASVLLIAQLATAETFSFTPGDPDGKVGALSRRASPGNIETETADDFVLQQTTIINKATIKGLLPSDTDLTKIKDVEVEIYHVFPLDSAPASGHVPSRVNSPSDVEIGTATRDGSSGTLKFSATVENASFSVDHTVVNGINRSPTNVTHGEPGVTREEVEITITFTSPIILPPGNYFFRPEVLVTGGDFLYLSAPRPIVPPGNAFVGDRQAWIRNSNLSPDWLRIGADIVVDGDTYNMAFSLNGETVPNAGTTGRTNCKGKTISALSEQFGTIDDATQALGFASVGALQDGVSLFCGR